MFAILRGDCAGVSPGARGARPAPSDRPADLDGKRSDSGSSSPDPARAAPPVSGWRVLLGRCRATEPMTAAIMAKTTEIAVMIDAAKTLPNGSKTYL